MLHFLHTANTELPLITKTLALIIWSGPRDLITTSEQLHLKVADTSFRAILSNVSLSPTVYSSPSRLPALLPNTGILTIKSRDGRNSTLLRKCVATFTKNTISEDVPPTS